MSALLASTLLEFIAVGVSERTGQYSAAAPVSPALVKIYEEVANIDESTLRKQLQQLDNDGKHAQSRKGKDDKTAVDPALLAEAIDFYLAASQGGRYDEEAHDDLDKGFLHAASALIKEMQGEGENYITFIFVASVNHLTTETSFYFDTLQRRQEC